MLARLRQRLAQPCDRSICRPQIVEVAIPHQFGLAERSCASEDDPETIAAYVRIARIVYGIDDDQHGLGEIDNPPTVVETLAGAKVRAWLPAAAPSRQRRAEKS